MKDVPSQIDLQNMTDAKEWARTALAKRPSRPKIFQTFVDQIENHTFNITKLLELGSGPGFLAEQILAKLPHVSYVAFDFSLAMHELAAERLGRAADSVTFVEGSFVDNVWFEGLGKFDCVVTNQAVHELRHKRYAARLHADVFRLLVPGGLYLMCDHFAGEGGMSNQELYMTTQEQAQALEAGGFVDPILLNTVDSLNLFLCTK